jgi:DnaA regulatory inactivator Hda
MQYTFSLPLPPLFGADHFMVSACNRDAWTWVNAWPKWSALLLYGESGCGKTHLGHIWAGKAGATVVSAAEISASDSVYDLPPTPPSPSRGEGEERRKNWLVEDIENVNSERNLLHFFNRLKESGDSVLFTTTHTPNQLPFTLPDLTSRLLALPTAHIDRPDDEALAGAMRKQFNDRQMKVDEDVITYILPRVERSFAKIKTLVEQLDQRALAEHKNITIPFVRRILG